MVDLGSSACHHTVTFWMIGIFGNWPNVHV